ncbi:hypothetical protein MMC11_001431 [Xylographa trunciseda]|nr:hypothetical protein [Xylographa trunciseda]
MAKEKVSSMSKWSDAEKLKVIFSIIDNSGPTKWSEVFIPPGRSVKAVKCMLDVTRKQMGLTEDDGTGAAPVTPTKRTKTPTKTKPKAAAKVINKASTTGMKRKRGACEPEDTMAEQEEVENQVIGSLKRVKSELEEVAGVAKEDTADFGDNSAGEE